MKRFNDNLEKVLLAFIVLFLTAMTAVVVLGIVARYILLVSIPWTEEMARYLMIWTAFMAFGIAYRRRELILVRLMVDRLPLKVYRYTLAFSDLLCAFFLVLVVVYGVKLCIMNANQVSPAARIPISIIYSAIPIGCGLCLLFIFESMINFVKRINGDGPSW